MTAIARNSTFTDQLVPNVGSQIELEFGTIVDTWNNHDSGTSRWTVVDTTTLKIAGVSVSIPSITSWTVYSPTITGCGTVTFSKFLYKQITDTTYVQGGFRVATPSGTGVSITLPVNILSTKVNTDVFPYFGFAITQNNGANTATTIGQMNPIFYDGSSVTTAFWCTSSGSGGFTKINGNVIYSGNEWISMKFDYPTA